MSCVRIFQTCGDPHSFLDIQVAGRSRISFGKFSWEKEGSIGVLSGGNKLCDFFFSKHHTYALFLLRKKNNLSSDCIFYLTLGLLIFHLLNLYDFPTFSSFGIQPVPSPCALIEAPYKKISSEHWDWRCNEITQKAEQLAQITRLQLFPDFQPWFAHLLAVEYIYLIDMKIFSDNFKLLL